jgi:two-component system, OmpR family, sensor histidine kinase MtrB
MASEAASRPTQPDKEGADTVSTRREGVDPVSTRGEGVDTVSTRRRQAGRVEQVVVRAGSIALAPISKLIRLWRRSIQARVVIGTLALSAVLSILAGWILLSRVADGLLESKRQAAISQTAAGVDTAQSAIDGADITNALDVGSVLNNAIELLSPRDPSRDDYFVAITGPSTGTDSPASLGGARGAGEIELDRTLPADLVERVAGKSGMFYAYTTLHFTDDALPDTPALVVGSQLNVTTTVPAERYSLFYVYPLHEQEQSLQVVRGALLTAGSLLVILLGVIAWLVARQVVRPVRLARRIAERLAAGRLEERMHVRGEDDIARLGTSFNQMASNLQQQIRRLEELSRMQRRFVADVSHELRTPLTTVRMAADILYDARERFDGATARSAELLQVQLDRFELLLTDLLEISRFDAGAAVLEIAEADLADVARRVIEATSALADDRRTRVTLVSSGPPALVQVDVRRIERIVRNLVVNAIEYGEGKPVEIRVAANDTAAAMTVRDHGIGLKPGEDVLVFTRFWRADPARSKTHGGTGLGLSIAVEDARLHGGKLQAWGHPGEGAVFRLTLPRRAGADYTMSPLPLGPQESSPAATSQTAITLVGSSHLPHRWLP